MGDCGVLFRVKFGVINAACDGCGPKVSNLTHFATIKTQRTHRTQRNVRKHFAMRALHKIYAMQAPQDAWT